MQLFRVKDCKQMDKKMSRLDFASISSRLGFTFILYNIKNSFLYVMRWAVLLSLFFYLIGLAVSAINAPFLGIITMRSFGGLFGGISCASLSWWGRFASRFTQCSTYLYSTSLLRVGGNNPISYLGLALAIAVWNLIC
jgi:hypothetical protein